MNVYDYFKQQLGVAPEDDTLSELSLLSNCGEDCKKAIDAAHALRHHCQAAGVEHQKIIDAAEDIVTTYWRG